MPDRSPLPYRFHVKPKLRAEIEAVLEPGESIQTFFGKAIAVEIARGRRVKGEASSSDHLVSDNVEHRLASDQRQLRTKLRRRRFGCGSKEGRCLAGAVRWKLCATDQGCQCSPEFTSRGLRSRLEGLDQTSKRFGFMGIIGIPAIDDGLKVLTNHERSYQAVARSPCAKAEVFGGFAVLSPGIARTQRRGF